MSQLGTSSPTITPADVQAQLQKENQALAAQLAAPVSPLLTAGDLAELQRDQQVCTILLAAVNLLIGYLATQSAPPPAATPAPIPAPPVSQPPSFFIENPTPNDVTATGATATLDLTGKITGYAATNGHAQLANVVGDGATVVTVTWPGVSTLSVPYPNSPGGATRVVDNASSNWIAFYGCKTLICGNQTMDVSPSAYKPAAP